MIPVVCIWLRPAIVSCGDYSSERQYTQRQKSDHHSQSGYLGSFVFFTFYCVRLQRVDKCCCGLAAQHRASILMITHCFDMVSYKPNSLNVRNEISSSLAFTNTSPDSSIFLVPISGFPLGDRSSSPLPASFAKKFLFCLCGASNSLLSLIGLLSVGSRSDCPSTPSQAQQ